MANDEIDALQIKIEQAKAKLPAETLNAINAVDWKAAIFSLREKKGYTFEQLGDLEIQTELLLCGLLSSVDYPRELEKSMEISRAQVDELVNEMNNLVFTRIKAELIKNTERNKIFANKSTPLITREVLAEPVESPYSAPVVEKPALHADDIHTLDLHGIKILPTSNVSAPKTVPIEPQLRPIEIPEEKSRSLVPEKLEIETTEQPKKIIYPVKNTEALQEAPISNKTHSILSEKLGGSVQNPVKETEHTLENISPSGAVNTAAISSKPTIDPYRELPE